VRQLQPLVEDERGLEATVGQGEPAGELRQCLSESRHPSSPLTRWWSAQYDTAPAQATQVASPRFLCPIEAKSVPWTPPSSTSSAQPLAKPPTPRRSAIARSG